MTYLVFLQDSVPPNPLFIILKEFTFHVLLAYRTRNVLRLVSWGNNDELLTKISLRREIYINRSLALVGTRHITHPILQHNQPVI